MAHVWHGMASLELQLGNINEARTLFRTGIDRFTGGAFTKAASKPQLPIQENNNYPPPPFSTAPKVAAVDEAAAAATTAGTTATSAAPSSAVGSGVGSGGGGGGGVPLRETATFLVHSLGMLEFQLKDYTAAFASFASGLELYPNNSHLLLGAALSLMKLNELESARELFRRAVSSDTKHAHAWQVRRDVQAGDEGDVQAGRRDAESGVGWLVGWLVADADSVVVWLVADECGVWMSEVIGT